MQTVISKATKADVSKSPFPHLVIENALPPEIADRLLAEYPPMDILGSGVQGLVKDGVFPNNEKLRYYSFEVLKDERVSPLWRDFTETHLSLEFYKQFFTLFEDSIRQHYPDLANKLAVLADKDLGIRKQDSFDTKTLLIDAEICVDTPVKVASTVKGPHLDNAKKLAIMLYYLKKPDDDSVGGDFELSTLQEGNLALDPSRMVVGGGLRKEKVVPYRHNTALVFLNTPESFHGVSPRQPTEQLRYSFDTAFELREPLFDVKPFTQVPFMSKVEGKLRGIARKLLKR